MTVYVHMLLGDDSEMSGYVPTSAEVPASDSTPRTRSRRPRPSLQGVRLIGARRKTASTNGNPRWTLSFDDGSILDTQSDAAMCYDVANMLHERETRLNVWLTKAGRVSYWERMTP